jgi:Tol biopolymer transport system component/DNA-binding winged helix-turn-helix (wHTH) protein
MSLVTKHFYDFENFRVDPGERVLLRDGKPVPLTPKAFQMLMILVENHGHIVDKEKLLSEIWADSFVEEGNLSVNARRLRKALADDANEPKFIETIPRRGYRFIAEVEDKVEGLTKELNGNLPTSTSMMDSRRHLLVAALLILAVGPIVIAALYAGRGFLNSAASAPILSAPFSADKFHSSGHTRIAISPDGQFAAFTDESAGKQSLWLRQIDSGENIQIIPPSDEAYYGLTFSSDGKTIYFVRRSEAAHHDLALYRVSAFGGIPVMLLARPFTWTSISVSPDDRHIAYSICSFKPDDFCSLYIADADGKNERRLLSRSKPIGLIDSQFSPNGKSIAFLAGRSLQEEPDLRLSIVDVASGSEREISQQRFFEVGNLQWLPSGDALMVTAAEYENGNYSFWQVTVANGEAKKVTSDAASFKEASLDRKGERMVASRIENDFHIFVKSGNEFEKLTLAGKMTFTPGGKIVYSTFDGDIWSVNSNGDERRQLTTGPHSDFAPRVSPDGRYIAFASNRSGKNTIWRMNADGTNPVQIAQSSGEPCGFSPDGKWLYFFAVKRLLKVPTDGGEEIPAYDKSRLNYPICSPDGNLVAYFFLEKVFKIGVINLADGSVVKTMDYGDGKSMALELAWSPDSKTLNFITDSDGTSRLWQQSLDEDRPRHIEDLGKDQVRALAMMPDGAGYAIIRGKLIEDAVLLTGLK